MSTATQHLDIDAEVIGQNFGSILERQRLAFETNRNPSYEKRKKQLKSLASALRTNRQEIIAALHEDFGHRVAEETRMAEIGASVANIEYLARNLRRWMMPRRRGTSIWFMPGSNRVQAQAVGVVGIIVPWNYPINIAVSPLAAALAAGNRVMIKMSEYTPASEQILREIIAAHFEADEVSVLGGDASAAAEFAALPFDHLFFTGSTHIGQKVMMAAAQNLTPVTLELGGKSPVIIDDDYPVEEASHRILWGKTLNAGQTCVAPDYVMIPKGKTEDFVIRLSRHYRKMYPKGALEGEYTSIINKRNFDRLMSLRKTAQAAGAEIVEFEELTDAHIEQRKLPFSLVLNPPADSRIMQEEIFGPILPVIEVKDLDHAIGHINASSRPLAIYYFGNSERSQDKVLQRTHSGGVTINDVLLQYLQVSQPFGGTGGSGFGNYHGKEGFETFSHMKSIFRQRGIGGFTGIKLLYPPYSNSARRLIGMMGG